jgi:hypothetical protein
MKELSGPDFEVIKYIISDNNTGQLYFNNYFNSHPNLSNFQRYFKTIPVQNNPPNQQRAGYAFQGSTNAPNGFSHLEFQLTKISCSSKYGGSIEYTFELSEDIEYEFTSKNYLYDLNSFSIKIYITPNNLALNATNTQGSNVIANSVPKIEFEYEIHTAYKKNGNYLSQNYTFPSIAIENENDRKLSKDEFDSTLEGFKSNLLASFSNLILFNAGVIRAINSPVFASSSTVVDRLQISENYISVQSHEGTKMAVISMRIKGIDVNTESGDEEFDIMVYEGQGYGFQWRRLAEFTELNQNRSSPWFYLGRFPVLNNCPGKSYYMHYDLVERDDAPVVGGSTIFTTPDHFDVRAHTIAISCANLVSSPINSVVDQGMVTDIEVHTENAVIDLQGHLAVEYKVYLKLE